MSKTAHTPEERAHLLGAIGAPPEAVEAAAQDEQPTPTRKKAKKQEVNTSLEQDVEAVVRSIVERAGADRDAALEFVNEHVEAVFDANKVSKIQAAQRGLDPSTHNKALWTAIQNLRSTLKTQVRTHYKGTIAAKIKHTSAVADDKRDAEFEAFVASDAMASAFEKWREAQKGQS